MASHNFNEFLNKAHCRIGIQVCEISKKICWTFSENVLNKLVADFLHLVFLYVCFDNHITLFFQIWVAY